MNPSPTKRKKHKLVFVSWVKDPRDGFGGIQPLMKCTVKDCDYQETPMGEVK